MSALKKTKEELAAEVPQDHVRLARNTRVIANRQGYHNSIREAGDVFDVPEGTIMEPNCWFEPVAEQKQATTEDENKIDDLSVPQIKIELNKRGVDFSDATKKADFVALLLKARAERAGEDLA